MIYIKNKIKSFLLISIISFSASCSPQPASVELSVNKSEVKLGLEKDGKFVEKEDKSFTNSDKILLKFKARGLMIKKSKIKANVDIFLKKDTDILGSQSNILGSDGISQTIPNIDSNYSGTSGEADLQISVLPPSDTKGELTANVTLKDLNLEDKLITFETKFSIK